MDEARDPEIVSGSTPQAPEAAREFVQEPAKLMRIAGMIRHLLGEAREATLDEAGRDHLHQIHERTIAALRETLSEDLQQELAGLTIPLDGKTPSQSELRIAQAQLVGWLEGLFQGIQAAIWAQSMQARAQLEELRRRGLPPGFPGGGEAEQGQRPGPGQYL